MIKYIIPFSNDEEQGSENSPLHGMNVGPVASTGCAKLA